MSDEGYNGWANHETWSLDLLLSNDHGLYTWALERVTEELDSDTTGYNREHVAGRAMKAFWEEVTDPDEGLLDVATILTMVRDVGSEYRIDWDEIGAHWLPEDYGM